MKVPMDISVVIVDDHPAISHGLKHVLGKCDDLNIVGDAPDGNTALLLIRRLQPRVVILDISLEGSNGINLISQIIEDCQDTGIIMYTTHNSKNYVMQSLKAGALGYVLKSDKIDELIKAVRCVVHRKLYISTNISSSIMAELITGTSGGDTTSSLTPREYEVASLIAGGNSINNIGDTLYISPKTVRVHRTNIMHKMGCKNVHELLLQLRNFFPQ